MSVAPVCGVCGSGCVEGTSADAACLGDVAPTNFGPTDGGAAFGVGQRRVILVRCSEQLRLRPMVVSFDATTIIDFVGLIGRAVAKYSGPDNYEGLDGYLEQLLNTTDTGLRRALTLGVLAGDQEAARFGQLTVIMMFCTGGDMRRLRD